jgi:hypothetical protein
LWTGHGVVQNGPSGEFSWRKYGFSQEKAEEEDCEAQAAEAVAGGSPQKEIAFALAHCVERQGPNDGPFFLVRIA